MIISKQENYTVQSSRWALSWVGYYDKICVTFDEQLRKGGSRITKWWLHWRYLWLFCWYCWAWACCLLAKIYSLLTPSPGIIPPCLNGVTEHGAVEKKLICGSVWHWAVNESLSHWEYWDWCRPHRESAADKAVVCPKQSRPSNEIHYKEGCLGNWYQEFVLIMSWLELARIPDWAACKILI